MSKDPAFLFYPGDYLRDTQCLSEKVQVAYDRIMCEHMRNICISKKQLKFFTKNLNEDEYEELQMVLRLEDGTYKIPWVVESIIKRRAYSDSRRKNRSGKKDKTCKTYVSHMENENENEDKDKDVDKNEKYLHVSEKLKGRILERKQMKITSTTIKNWNNNVRLMIERDNRVECDIIKLIDECHDMAPTKSGFTWANNILSMDKLRKQWNDGKIYIGMNKKNNKKYTPEDFQRDLQKDYGGMFDE